jgi:hypothetical protein
MLFACTGHEYLTKSDYRKNFDLYWRDCAVSLGGPGIGYGVSPIIYSWAFKDCVDRKANSQLRHRPDDARRTVK